MEKIELILRIFLLMMHIILFFLYGYLAVISDSKFDTILSSIVAFLWGVCAVLEIISLTFL